MKYITLCLLIVTCGALKAQQINPNEIHKSWVLSKITFDDDSEVPDDEPLKYAYIKYSFNSSGKAGYSTLYYTKGGGFLFEIKNNELIFKSEEGNPMNAFLINNLTQNSLIITQKGFKNGNIRQFLKYYFTPEEGVKNSIILTKSDIYTVLSGDTIYNQNPKVYPTYKNDNFQDYLYKNVGVKMDGKSGRIAASFIVSKTGLPDSLQLLEGISNEFDKGFIKAFNKAKKDWKPATLNGKNVSVKMNLDLRYTTSAITIPNYFDGNKAFAAFKNKDYETAIALYDKIIASDKYDITSLYKRGLTKLMMGNITGAREDWKTIQKLGATTADKILEKYNNQ
jgi:tetratricopeptide (TPR) repeat protein